MSELDLVTLNRMIFDSTGGPRYRAYLGIRDGAIAQIGRIAPSRAAREINATVVHDLDQLAVGPMEVAHDVPSDEWRRVQRAEGHRYVVVDGEVTIEDDKRAHTYSGHVLRHGAN